MRKNKKKYIPVEMDVMLDDAVIEMINDQLEKIRKNLNNDVLYLSILGDKLIEVRRDVDNKILSNLSLGDELMNIDTDKHLTDLDD